MSGSDKIRRSTCHLGTAGTSRVRPFTSVFAGQRTKSAFGKPYLSAEQPMLGREAAVRRAELLLPTMALRARVVLHAIEYRITHPFVNRGLAPYGAARRDAHLPWEGARLDLAIKRRTAEASAVEPALGAGHRRDSAIDDSMILINLRRSSPQSARTGASTLPGKGADGVRWAQLGPARPTCLRFFKDVGLLRAAQRAAPGLVIPIRNQSSETSSFRGAVVYVQALRG